VAVGDPYIVAYAQLGDGRDEQSVRVLGPIDLEHEPALERGRRLAVRFRVSSLRGRDRLHHYFVPED
jgi:hypothetical protein